MTKAVNKGGRPEEPDYVEVILNLQPNNAYRPADILRLAPQHVNREGLAGSLRNRAQFIRRTFPGIQPCDGIQGAYPGILWQATLNVNTLGRTRFRKIQDSAQTAAASLLPKSVKPPA